jgi:hypothetical protein
VRRGRRYRQRQCRHLDALGIYGDGINITGKRGFCQECGLMLDSLPYKVTVTDKTPTPAVPDRDGYLVADQTYLRMVKEFPVRGDLR